MWIEEELQKDSTGIQRSIQALTRDYHKQLPRSIRSRLPENKEKTTDFLNHFYDQLRNAEFFVYQKMTNPVSHFNSPKSKTRPMTSHIRAFSRNYSAPMICGVAAQAPAPTTTTDIFRIKYMLTSERNPSIVSSSSPPSTGARFHFIS